MKKVTVLLLILFICMFAFAETISLTLTLRGNTHVLSHNDLAKLYSLKNTGDITWITPEQLYDYYQAIDQQYSDNYLMKEQKQKEAENNIHFIFGKVNKVRRSILDEYIVELQVDRDWSLMGVSVVFPQNISQAMLDELLQLKKGDSFSALVFTRKTYAYVDVAVWDSNGTYRTEP